MLLASVPGSFAGLYILQICSGPVLQGAVGLLLLYYVYWQKTFRARGTIAHPRALGAVAGFGSGLLGTAIAFDGPPVGPTACAWAGNRVCCWARWAFSSCCAPP